MMTFKPNALYTCIVLNWLIIVESYFQISFKAFKRYGVEKIWSGNKVNYSCDLSSPIMTLTLNLAKW